MISLDQAIIMIGNFGFPIAIALYFILKTERVVKNNTIALTRFVERVKECEVRKSGRRK